MWRQNVEQAGALGRSSLRFRTLLPMDSRFCNREG